LTIQSWTKNTGKGIVTCKRNLDIFYVGVIEIKISIKKRSISTSYYLTLKTQDGYLNKPPLKSMHKITYPTEYSKLRDNHFDKILNKKYHFI